MLDSIIQEIKRAYPANAILPADGGPASLVAQAEFPLEKEDHLLLQGDSCDAMRLLLEGGFAGRIQCIYLDPPFLSGADYQATVRIRSEKLDKELPVKVPAYADTWRVKRGEKEAEDSREKESGPAAYFRKLAEAMALARQLLADTGLLWLHLDWHSAHYARIMLDEIFGEERFLNEIIWQYKSGGSSRRHYARKHDTILLYAKTADYALRVGKEKSYNRGLKPYRFKGVEEYQDEKGWYTLVNAKDVWSIDMVGRTSAERNGYATQKPFALMERIVLASSEPGDLVADFCCGSGGFLDAAAAAGRCTIGCDRSSLALALTEKRLRDAGIGSKRISLTAAANGVAGDEGDPCEAILRKLKGKEQATFREILERDPKALVLFEEQQADGILRTVDVFGRETYHKKHDTDQLKKGQEDM